MLKVFFVAAFLAAAAAPTENSAKVQVCHKQGKSGKTKTLSIGADARQAHLDHGDNDGPCETSAASAPAPEGVKKGAATPAATPAPIRRSSP